MNNKVYLAIDLKSFFASVECADRGLDPLTTNLVVADESKTEKTICLAVSHYLKAYGLGGRCRLFEVGEVVRNVKNRTGETVEYIVAPPRMARYMEVSAQIYNIYLDFVSGDDIFAYSVDEVFIDATPYLKAYGLTAHELAVKMIRAVLAATGITATCGIGTNMYLAKVAMDIVAKHVEADEDGVRIAELNEMSYRQILWDHKPLRDFWRIGPATAKKLNANGMHTMGDVARMSLHNQEWFYKTFGIDAEILIDHAWGLEPTTVAEVKAYKPMAKSICEGQVLQEAYTNEKARIIVMEMADSIMYQLVDKGLVTDLINLDIGCDRENCDKGIFKGVPKLDHYGRLVPPPAHGSHRLEVASNLGSVITSATLEIFDRITEPELSIRRISITAGNLVEDGGAVQFDLFSDVEKQENEKNLQEALLSIKKRYGKNAILKGTNFEDGATMRQRNEQIGGHKA